jgi:hypothetical protein
MPVQGNVEHQPCTGLSARKPGRLMLLRWMT